jgi:hypothetical protein
MSSFCRCSADGIASVRADTGMRPPVTATVLLLWLAEGDAADAVPVMFNMLSLLFLVDTAK